MPANQIVDHDPGEIFVHRNVANVVVHTDLNCLSVMQFAVEVLKVKHIIVCGHYGRGGVAAAMKEAELGLIENWLRHIQDVRNIHRDMLQELPDEATRIDRMCELNVIEQAMNVCRATIVRDAWPNGQELSVNGFIYSLRDGRLRDLKLRINNRDEVSSCYATAVDTISNPVA